MMELFMLYTQFPSLYYIKAFLLSLIYFVDRFCIFLFKPKMTPGFIVEYH